MTENGSDLLIKVVQSLDGEHSSVAERFLLSVVEKEGQVRVRGGSLRGETGGRSRRLRLGRGLSHAEAPSDRGGLVFGSISLYVLEGENVVRAVSTTNVGVESCESDPLILVLEESREHVEDGEARVDNVLEDFGLGGAIRSSYLSVGGLSDRSLEDLFELNETLIEGRKLSVDENFTSLESDLGSRLRVEFGEILEDRGEGGFDEGKRIGFFDEFEEGEDERVLRGGLVVRENEFDDFIELVTVSVSEFENDIIVTAREGSLSEVVSGENASDGVPLVLLEAIAVTVDDVIEGDEEVSNSRGFGGTEFFESRVDSLAKTC